MEFFGVFVYHLIVFPRVVDVAVPDFRICSIFSAKDSKYLLGLQPCKMNFIEAELFTYESVEPHFRIIPNIIETYDANRIHNRG